MNHQNELRSSVHNRRALAARQRVTGADDDDDDDANILTKTRTRITVIRPTATIDPKTIRPIIPPIIPPIPPLGPGRSTTTSSVLVTPTTTLAVIPGPTLPKTTSSVASSTTTPVAPPLNTSKSTTPITTPTKSATGATDRALVSPSSSQPSSTSTSQSSTSGGVSTGALVGGIGGGIVGVGVLAFAIFFFVRRYRKKSADTIAFNATKFRRSALMLDDPPIPPKDTSKPRPPTMIERRMQAPTVPAASYPYGEQAHYGADPYGQYSAGANQYNVSQYGADGQLTRDPYGSTEQYGGNVSGATYGQHASYAAYGTQPNHPPHPQYPQHQQQPQYQGQHFPQQYTLAPGDNIPTHRGAAALPNPFTQPVTTSAAALAAARSAAGTTSPAPSSVSASTDSSNTAYLHRQNTQTSGAPPAYEHDARYADVQRDVKTAPVKLTLANSAPESPGAGPAARSPAPTAAQRPTSAYTVYDPEDAYGGM